MLPLVIRLLKLAAFSPLKRLFAILNKGALAGSESELVVTAALYAYFHSHQRLPPISPLAQRVPRL
jgi:hypothetical protein